MSLFASTTVRIPALALMGLVLVSCQRNDNLQDLESFVAEVKSRPGEEVEPVPEFVPYEGFVYSAASLRSAFSRMPVRKKYSSSSSEG